MTPAGYRCPVCAGEVPDCDALAGPNNPQSAIRNPQSKVCPHCGSEPARAVVKAVLRDPRRRHTPAEGARREKHGGSR